MRPFVPLLIVALLAGCSSAADEPPAGSAQTGATTVVPTTSPGTSVPATTAATVAPTTMAPTTTAAATPEWSIGEIVPIGVEGVSPEIVRRADGSYLLLVTSMDGGAYSSADGVTFTRDATVSIPPGADYSLLEAPDGTWRMYYVEFEPIGQATPGQPPDPNNVLKVVKVATSPSLDTFGRGQPTGVAQQVPTPAWGVPDTYLLPDGRTAMLYVELGDRDENILLATSADGLTFTSQAEPVLTGGYVDPYVIELGDGSYLGVLSTGPGRPPQRLHLATSPDGLAWTVDPEPFLVDATVNYLDPAAVQIGPEQWLLVISTAVGDPINGRHELAVTTLTRNAG